ncbi:hypothetical protein EBZ39_03025 [bacterium]|nr:hypothetical protein [bacterium]
MSDIDPYDRATIDALITGYREHYARDTFRAVAIEQEFRLPIFNPHSKRVSTSKTYEYSGKIDLLVDDPMQPGKIWLMDHKTTSEDIENQASPFWMRLRNATQPTHYQLALKQLGLEIDGCVWDVIKKPTIRPRKLTKEEKKELEMFGTYHGVLIDMGYVPDAEQPEHYAARVLSDIRATPGKYFQRQIVPRTNEDLYEYASELFGISTRIRECETDGRFYKTGEPHSCTLYNRTCEYLPLCVREGSTFDYVQSPGHSELEDQGDGLKILTNSSLSMFRQCERKYRYRYVDGLKPMCESSSLGFGTAFHVAMNNFWSDRLAPESERIYLKGVSVE